MAPVWVSCPSTRSLTPARIRWLPTAFSDATYWETASMNVLPRSSLPRSRSTTADPVDAGPATGSWASNTGAEAKKRLP